MYEISVKEIERQVLDFMAELEVAPLTSQNLTIDGNLHRYDVIGDRKGSKNGYYRIYGDGLPAGYVGSWKSGELTKWKFNISHLDVETQQSLNTYERSAEYKRKQETRELLRQGEQTQASDEARVRFEQAPEAEPDHPYLKKKNVNAYGIKQLGDDLLIPLYDENGHFCSIQKINADPQIRKLFWPGASTSGAFFPIADDLENGPVLICEGYATGATLHELTGLTVICAMTCYNITTVAVKIRKLYPKRKIFVAADNDHNTKGNPGLKYASKAVENAKLDGYFFPEFPEGHNGTDWNDYTVLVGDEAEKILRIKIEQLLSAHVNEDKLADEEKESPIVQPGIENLAWEFNHREVVEPVQFAAGLFPIGKLSIVAAPTGVGKSWFVQRLATDLSNGGSIFECLTNSAPMRSMVFAGEGGRDQMILRGSDAGWVPCGENFVIVDAIPAALRGFSLMLDDPQGQTNIKRLVETYSPQIVFFDSLLTFHTLDESNYKAMSPVLMWLLHLAQDKKLAVVATHHQRKPKRTEQRIPASQDDIIGSSVFARLAAFCLKLEAIDPKSGALLGSSPEGEYAVKVSCTKSWFKKPKPFMFQIIDGQMTINKNLVFRPEIDEEIQEAIVETFEDGATFKAGDIQKLFPRRERTSISKALSRLVHDGYLLIEGKSKGTKYKIVKDYSSDVAKILTSP